jgi:toxin ParE1/3/4
MTYTVDFAPEAEEQLAEIYRYIADHASPATAANYTGAIVDCCEGLHQFPHRGTPRDDLRPGVRLTHYKGRTVIAYAVDEASQRIAILGIFYGGRDHESALRSDQDT